MLLVLMENGDLVIPRICIHEAEKFMTCSGIDHLVDSGHREVVLRTGLAEVSEVHAAPPRPVWLRDQIWIGDPSRVLHFANELGPDEPVDFAFKGLGSFRDERPPLLPSGWDPRINVETVVHQIRVYALHITMALCKHVSISP